MSEELKPCPFCGSSPEVLELPDPDKRSGWTIRCCRIDDFGYESSSREELIGIWNRRADLTLSPDELRRVREALEKGKDRTQRWCHTQGNVQAFFEAEIAPINAALAILASKEPKS